MRRLGFLALGVVVAAFAYLCFTVLAPWQLGKNTKTSRENSQIEHSLTADPVPLTSVLDQPDTQWHRVTATGHYLADKQVLARLRTHQGNPAFEVLVPFAVDAGPIVLVNRGYVAAQDSTRVPAIPPPPAGTVSITARLRDSEQPGQNPITADGFPQVYAISTAQVAELTRVALAGPYLQLVDGQPGGLGVIGVPHLDAGPFLSYGIQWIAFGILAPIGLGYFAYSEIRARRAEKAEKAQKATTTEAPMTVEQKLADRYGRRR